jgi:predicted adenylyl cyclase CyaB
MEIRNIEIKLHIDDPDRVRTDIERIADGPARRLRQVDTYYRTGDDALLKLRRESCDDGPWRARLLAYRRTLGDEPVPSDIRLVDVADGDGLHDALAHALATANVVRKTRELSFHGQTRIHLDTVVGLGAFVELEVVLQDGQTHDDGRRIAAELMERLGLIGSERMTASYRDLVGDDRGRTS